MSLEVILLILRIAIVLALYGFLGILLLYIRRDILAVSEHVEETQHAAAALVVIECEDVPLEVGSRFDLQPMTSIGRGPTNTISLPDTFASTEHARIALRRGQWWLNDQNSRNGTLLNDVLITGTVVLSSGDVIGIGRVRMRFEST
jgi:hypothetical protein